MSKSKRPSAQISGVLYIKIGRRAKQATAKAVTRGEVIPEMRFLPKKKGAEESAW